MGTQRIERPTKRHRCRLRRELRKKIKKNKSGFLLLFALNRGPKGSVTNATKEKGEQLYVIYRVQTRSVNQKEGNETP